MEAPQHVVRDGCFAVIYHAGYGSEYDGDRFNVDVILYLLKETSIITEAMRLACRDDCDKYINELRVAWLPIGTMFQVHEYDGAESVVRFDPRHYYTVTEEDVKNAVNLDGVELKVKTWTPQ